MIIKTILIAILLLVGLCNTHANISKVLTYLNNSYHYLHICNAQSE